MTPAAKQSVSTHLSTLRRAALALLSAALLAAGGCDARPAEDEPATTEQEPARVVVETATSGHVTEQINTTGTIKPLREVIVAAEGSGLVIALPVSLGAAVARGAPLAWLDATVQEARLEQAHASLAQARAALELASGDFERASTLHGQHAVTDQVMQQRRIQRDSSEAAARAAEAGVTLAEKAVADCTLRAPFAGTVAEVKLELGALVAPGTPAFHLVSVERVRVLAALSGSDVGRVEEGMPVQLQVPTLGERIFEAHVEHIGPSGDPRTRTYPLEVVVENEDGALRPGMLAKVDVILAHRSDAVLLSRSCIIEGATAQAFVVKDGRAELRSLDLGESRGEQIEVRSGIAAGELVVSLGRQSLRDGDPVSIYDMPAARGAAPADPPATAARATAPSADAETD
jgi:membrane fusion protein (multidrug efflux system)